MRIRKVVRCLVLGVGKIPFALVLACFFIFLPSPFILAHPHTRLYACAIGNDAPGTSMGGSSMGAGLWQSDDTAKTWTQVGWKHVKCYSVDVVNKSNGKTIYQACGNGVLRSTDGGMNWKMLTDWRITEVMDVAIDQQSPKNIYIGTPTAVWKSNDGGDSWFEADSDIPFPIFASRIIIDPKNHSKIYAAVDTAIYFSNDGGLQWKNSHAPALSARDLVVDEIRRIARVDSEGVWVWLDTNVSTLPVTVDPYIHSTPLYPGRKGTFGFANGADTKLPEIPKNIHSFISIGKHLLIASLDGGVWKYEYAPGSDAPERTGLDLLQVWRLKSVEIK
ncbi:MAG: hypothetical protein ABI778_09425 [Ignavibacteriota bacterium]